MIGGRDRSAGVAASPLPPAGEGKGEGPSARSALSGGPLILTFSRTREKGAWTSPPAREMTRSSERILGSSNGAFYWIALAQRRARAS